VINLILISQKRSLNDLNNFRNKFSLPVSNILLSKTLVGQEVHMVLAVFSILVALFLGFGAVEEFIMRGVRGGEVQPFFVGLVGICVSVLLALSGIALWRQWATARRLLFIAAISSVVFHVYAAMPPHRNVGVLALIVGAGYGLILLGIALSSRGSKAQTA
jgi:hypothetical protein